MNGQKIRSSKYSIKQKKRTKSIFRTENLFREVEKKQQIKEHNRELEKGDLSEEKADMALSNLMIKLEKLIIFSHGATEKDSPKDHNGVDHIIIMIFPEHEKIEFQIKSSEIGARNHKKKYPKIPVVVIRVNKGELNTGVLVNIKEAEKEILDKLFKEYFIRNYDKISYEEFLKENYE